MIIETGKSDRKTPLRGDLPPFGGGGSGARTMYAWLNRLRQHANDDYAPYYQLAFRLLLLPVLLSLPILMFPVLRDNMSLSVALIRLLSFVLLVAPVYAINIVYFIPSFLTLGRYRAYLLLLVVSCVLTAWIGNEIVNALPVLSDFKGISGRLNPPIGPLVLVPLGLSTIFEMILHWENRRRKIEQIDKEKVQMELSFLKAQINPHFLFNTLNNIHSMAELKSDKTGDAILMLSDLLRYMLYDSSHGKVPLQKEIESIENYMAIQRLRIPKRESIQIKLDTGGHYQDSDIEPQLLLPFVENAFKHGISYRQKSVIGIDLHVENNVLQFNVCNTKRQDQASLDNADDKESGIGLTNIRRRLELTYPGKHTLQINQDKDVFEIRLTVHL